MATTELRVEFDTNAVQAKLGQALTILKSLPEGVANQVRERFADFRDLSVDFVVADDATAGSTGSADKCLKRYVAVCPVLDELIAAAIGAADVD